MASESSEFYKQERQEKLRRRAIVQWERMQFCRNLLIDAGIKIHYENASELQFFARGNRVRFYPYTGWWTGRGIGSGRGIGNLLKQIKAKKKGASDGNN